MDITGIGERVSPEYAAKKKSVENLELSDILLIFAVE